MTQKVYRGTENKITQEMLDEMLAEKGREYPAKGQWNTEATRDAIRHWCEGIGDLNPLWLDEEYAKKTRHGTIIAPPTFLFTCSGRAGRHGLPGIHALFSRSHWHFFKPVRLNDQIKRSGGLHDLVEKASGFAKRSFIQVFFENYRNQDGELVATHYSSSVRAERDTATEVGKYNDIRPHEYTEEELQEIWRGIEAEEVRGANSRYWEDVGVGDELVPVVKGPLTMSDVVGFKMGWGSHLVHMIRANETRYWMIKRHPGLPIRNRLNVPDCPEGVHMVSETAGAIGIPGWYDYGPQRVAWAAHLVANWMGDDGWLKELDVQVRRPNIEGDVQWYRGQVSRKWQEGDEHLVTIDIRAENQRGEVTAPGMAVIALPTSDRHGE
ncbi:MAG: MaoC family dehydratase N-terminal domain-containing protein [Chloroflexi bacterium]|nr:MaoC family dehydratase N-terminal domain-containing protein [Chloroflexota bacterium]